VPFLQVGWHEHDPLEIWRNTVTVIQAVVTALAQKSIDLNLQERPLVAVGITNQRETTVAWNAQTGVPYYNAIVWDDVRTTHIAHEISRGDVNRLRKKTGLPLASYFAGTKVRWLLENCPALQTDLNDPQQRDHVRFGTIDTWVMYQLTGTKSTHEGAGNVGGIFVTDVSNASRWLFLNIDTVQWDPELVDAVCAPYQLPLTALPTVCPSSHVYATCHGTESCGIPALDNVPLAAVLGDQQAALFGQCAFEPGEAKNTYGTGLFLMMNTGTHPTQSQQGLLTTIAYQIGATGPVYYALEGSVSHSGSTIQWLRDQLGLISSATESETLARTTTDNDGLYLVPAFAGLFAPHWRSDARACIVGMTATHHKGHVCRAALEAAAYQTREVFEAIYTDSHVQLKSLKVDGGATNNMLLMQFQADIVGVPVVKPVVMETTSIGAAFAAGLAVGLWKDTDDIKCMWAVAETFYPEMPLVVRERYWKGWKKAISKSLDWVDEEEDDKFVDALTSSFDDYAEPPPPTTETKSPGAGGTNSSYFKTTTTTTIAMVAVMAFLGGFFLGRRRK
jgi:glycerol kinase